MEVLPSSFHQIRFFSGPWRFSAPKEPREQGEAWPRRPRRGAPAPGPAASPAASPPRAPAARPRPRPRLPLPERLRGAASRLGRSPHLPALGGAASRARSRRRRPRRRGPQPARAERRDASSRRGRPSTRALPETPPCWPPPGRPASLSRAGAASFPFSRPGNAAGAGRMRQPRLATLTPPQTRPLRTDCGQGTQPGWGWERRRDGGRRRGQGAVCRLQPRALTRTASSWAASRGAGPSTLASASLSLLSSEPRALLQVFRAGLDSRLPRVCAADVM